MEKNMAKLTIEVAAEDLEKAMQNAYQKAKGRISIPGFRKGKAPRKMIEQMYGKGIFLEDAVNALIPEHYSKALAECDLEIVSQPTIDITQAEAVADMINAKTDMSYNLSLKAFDGSVRDFINCLADSLKMLIANIEVAIDYPEEDIEEISYERITNTLTDVKDSLAEHIRRASTSTLIKDGIKTSIVGVPNVGKSSLLNTFTREETAIVSNIEGTTRDMITEYIDLEGISLKLMDTAGIREASDEIERMGVAISKKAIKDADLVLAVFDYSKPMTEGDKEIINMVQDKKHIYTLNKVDEGENGEYLDHFEQNAKFILTSLKTGEGFEALKDMIKDMFLAGDISQDELVYANLREMDLLNKAHAAISEALKDAEHKQVYDLLIVNIRAALDSLLEILGEKLDSEILDKIFQNFCIGK